MRYLIPSILVMLTLGCENKSTKEETKFIEVSEEAPYFVAVRTNDYGDVEYLDVDSKMSEEQARQVIHQRDRNWKRVGSDRQINGAYPEQSQEKSFYFVEDPSDFQPDLDGPSGYSNYRRCGNFNSGYHIYYGYRGYRHCYPEYTNYHGYYYHPAFYWRRNYYYYQPVYRPYYYGNWYYYVYRAGWWW